jgi:hypothetical protein
MLRTQAAAGQQQSYNEAVQHTFQSLAMVDKDVESAFPNDPGQFYIAFDLREARRGARRASAGRCNNRDGPAAGATAATDQWCAQRHERARNSTAAADWRRCDRA